MNRFHEKADEYDHAVNGRTAWLWCGRGVYKKITEKLTEKQEQRKELAGIRDQYAKALQVASEESRREGIKQAYAATKQEEQEKKAALDAFADVFPGQVPQDEEFAKQNQDVQMLGVLKTTLFNLGLRF